MLFLAPLRLRAAWRYKNPSNDRLMHPRFGQSESPERLERLGNHVGRPMILGSRVTCRALYLQPGSQYLSISGPVTVASHHDRKQTRPSSDGGLLDEHEGGIERRAHGEVSYQRRWTDPTWQSKLRQERPACSPGWRSQVRGCRFVARSLLALIAAVTPGRW